MAPDETGTARERALQSITWRQQHATRVELDFGDGEIEVVDATHADAARMAEEAGLRLVDSPLGSVRWTRAPRRAIGNRVPKRIGPWLSSNSLSAEEPPRISPDPSG